MTFKATIKNNQKVANEVFEVPPKVGPVKVKINFTQPPIPNGSSAGELFMNKKISNEIRLFVILQKTNLGANNQSGEAERGGSPKRSER